MTGLSQSEARDQVSWQCGPMGGDTDRQLGKKGKEVVVTSQEIEMTCRVTRTNALFDQNNRNWYQAHNQYYKKSSLVQCPVKIGTPITHAWSYIALVVFCGDNRRKNISKNINVKYCWNEILLVITMAINLQLCFVFFWKYNYSSSSSSLGFSSEEECRGLLQFREWVKGLLWTYF